MALLDSLLYGLGQTESSGNYSAIGPQTRSGDRAYGKYQVMGQNIGPWTEQTLGKRLSPSEFLKDQDAQDAVARNIFGGYVEKYGPAGAASMWFSGRPDQPNVSDGYIKTPAYVQRVLKHAEQYSGQGQGDTAIASASPGAPTAPPVSQNAPNAIGMAPETAPAGGGAPGSAEGTAAPAGAGLLSRLANVQAPQPSFQLSPVELPPAPPMLQPQQFAQAPPPTPFQGFQPLPAFNQVPLQAPPFMPLTPLQQFAAMQLRPRRRLA